MIRRALCVLLASLVLLGSEYLNDQKLEKALNFTSDAEWIDTGAAGKKVPHSIKGYRGRVLLIDFGSTPASTAFAISAC